MTRQSLRSNGRGPALVVSLLVVVSMIAVPALAAPPGDDGPKTFTAAVTPLSPCVGEVTDFVVTLTNTSAQQLLGSADVSSQLGVTTASLPVGAAGTAQVSSGVIELRDLSLQPQSSVAVTFSGTAATAGTHVLDIVAKQANNFQGDPGNDLTLTNGPVQVTATTCTPAFADLDFSVEPADARVSTAVPGQDGTSPTVRLVDASGTTVAATGVTVTVTLLGGTAAGFTTDSTTSVTTTAGVATFSNLKVGATGVGYTLRAQAGTVSEDSTAFNVHDEVCLAGEQCTATTARVGGVVASASGTAGTADGGLSLAIAAKSGPDDACGAPVGYELTRIPSETTAVGVGLADKLITFEIDKRTDQAISNNGVSFYQVCATPRAPFTQFSTFTDRFGATVWNPADDVNAEPAGSYQASGLLPDCSANGDVPPCVVSRVKSRNGNPVITVRWGSGFRFG